MIYPPVLKITEGSHGGFPTLDIVILLIHVGNTNPLKFLCGKRTEVRNPKIYISLSQKMIIVTSSNNDQICLLSLPGALYDVSDSYEVAFYIAGVIPIITSVIMFSIPFLMPTQPTNTNSQLLKSYAESTHSLQDDDMTSSKDNIYLSPPPRKHTADGRHRPSVSSFSQFGVTLEKKVSIRDIGSLSSFGSMILSPSVPSRKSSMLAVSYRPHSRTMGDA